MAAFSQDQAERERRAERERQVLALVPDPAAARAGRGQAVSSRWRGLGHDAQAVWGECQGSGTLPYRVQAVLGGAAGAAGGATRCSCPSRKFPCKHAIGLLLLHAGGAVPERTKPDWVAQWLASRAERAATAGRRLRPGPDAPADPQTAARRAAGRDSRAASRDKKVAAGVDEMRRWLADLASGGLAAAQSRPWSWWDQQARRMIDAQARGLAGQIRRMAGIAATAGLRADWPERLTDQLGAAHLLCEAWARRDRLPEPTAQALRVRLGYSVGTEDVTASGDRVLDTWAVLGQRISDEGSLRTRQQWLYGEQTGQVVTFLSFAAGAQPLPPGLPAGRRTRATVALYPGTRPARVLITERSAASDPLGPLPGEPTWDAALDLVADLLCADPWADFVPLAVRGLLVIPDGEPWLLRDRDSRAMPVAATPDTRWALLAISGGRPVDVAGEWDGFAFIPQAAAPGDRPGRLLP